MGGLGIKAVGKAKGVLGKAFRGQGKFQLKEIIGLRLKMLLKTLGLAHKISQQEWMR